MKLQARFLVLFMFLFGAVASLLLLQRWFDFDRSATLLQNELKQQESYYEKISKLDQQPLKSFSVDYSFWDEMVEFVAGGDLTFAQNNIDPGLEIYGASAAWVYGIDTSLVYFKAVDDDSKLQAIELPASFFTHMNTKRLDHFYLRHQGQIIEIRAATIHPSSDAQRVTAPRGYWLVGRLLDSSYISNLSGLTQNNVSLNGAEASTASELGSNTVTFSRKLSNWMSQPQGVITLVSQVPIVDDLRSIYARQLSLLAAFAVATIIVLIGAIWYLVLFPLRTITSSLKHRDPAQLQRLSRQNTEFGALAQTIQQFFAQDTKIRDSSFIKEKLVELNRAKSEFLAIAAHELKSSIGNVYVFAGNLSQLISTRTPKKVLLTEVERISHQAHRANVLINDLYQASKGGQAIILNRKKFDMDDFIREEVADAQYSIPQHIIIHGFTAAHITSDKDRLSQVIANLLHNASKYSPHARTIRVALRRAGSGVVIEVRDDGMGIAVDDQPRIFERFFRSQDVTAKIPGLGVGLSVCKDIVEALGGKIWFATELGHGSTFYVSLPYGEANSE